MTSTSTLYQGLQSCLEPTLVEPRVLMNKLPPPISNFPQSTTLLQMSNISPQEAESEEENGHSDMSGGWSFIHELENPCQYPKKGDAEDEVVYVHPMVKSSSLNTKSLEMCTESLGSETGSDISESMEELSPFLSEKETNFQRSKSREFTKKFNRASSFPPPLTSMSGNEGVQVRPHREGGRLVLKAVTINSCNSYFQAERADGRLRLSILRHEECSIGEEHENSDENDEENEEEDDEICGRKLGSHDIGVGEYARASRCKASESRNKGIPSWEPFWVAIS
ncbi:PREDICTED: protein FANTASTIC FOUR 3-like [Nicotiana attenuata]|uniref:Protein fantastic four 3 n=1 Tax=Nicotiana attenuata TaxID=49451 RepID=A0A1J6JN81_NICAT|nr:PREDICTED: protein FANTASTIC FOUR 3-like [Nicotiana attenuata]XP_019241697.1 PREDICTED: protein FANTASTIC FOUR 3-like [Nicotiana attenuata]OIT19242.1 protein fantastic four 3 [Nicotiana attenuata]OIT32613.1 protein fantastic four 3 [Nicotiana attenuata]